MPEKRGDRGFTLIELLVVIAIIAILAAIAIPTYRSQTIKARMTEVTHGISTVASAAAAYWAENNYNWPGACNSKTAIQNTLGVSLAALDRISAINVDPASGNVTATIANVDNVVNNKTLVLSSSINADSSIRWEWDGSSTVPSAYLPRR